MNQPKNEPKKKIDHMVFNVRNLDEAVRFYTEVVGMKVVMRFDDRKMAFLSFGDRLGDIRLFETGATADPDRQTHGFNHVAFEPEGGLPVLDELHRRLIEKGAKIDRLEEKVDRGFAAIDTRFTGMDARFEAVDARFRGIDARFEQVFQTIATNTRILLDAIRGKLGS